MPFVKVSLAGPDWQPVMDAKDHPFVLFGLLQIDVLWTELKIFLVQENGQLKLNVQYVSMSAISQVGDPFTIFLESNKD